MRPLAMLFCAAAMPALAGHELDNRDTALGQTLYAEQCAACHGAALEGAPDWQTPDDAGIYPAPPHDATGHTWHHGNQDLYDYVDLGGQVIVERLGLKGFTSGMPGFGEVLSEDEIWTILAFIKSTWPARLQEVQASRTRVHD